ncbi:MAG: phenylalanine--tRNA ligase subunit beta [Chloroflexi bacterium]|nr:phenylalanine--tRNA ligase subunit beta [Chloroflexota bacterium]|tara:strand:+ start:52120 stop:54648 length:2529 start_codon:yes stop_codon:yes gene_type:complete
MKIPISWIKKYIDPNMTPTELAHHLTMVGIEVAEVNEIGANWEKSSLFVGEIKSIEPHPNADRLKLVSVLLTESNIEKVVCGAPNIQVGQKIIFATEGAILFNPRNQKTEPLKAAKIRGIESKGMVCSELELQLSSDHEGILVLPESTPIGTPAKEILADAILDIEITPNRPDCLSVLGIVHEIAAITKTKFQKPDVLYQCEGLSIAELASVTVENPEICNRYTGNVLTNVKIDESPKWLQDALTKSGQRPINNIVDITNFVMLEYGQPLHAFDLDKISGDKIFVRRAKTNESIKTLDGETRKLTPEMLTISDELGPIGLAGIIGGTRAEIDSKTKNIFLESANFDSGNIRATRTDLKISTEASYRFERNIRPAITSFALKRATQMILEICGGVSSKEIIDQNYSKEVISPISVNKIKMKNLIGKDYSNDSITSVLISLGFEKSDPPTGLFNTIETIEAKSIPEREETMWFTPPYWRSDISIEEDLIEEIVRISGYDEVPTEMLSSQIPHQRQNIKYDIREQAKDLLVASGMQEIISYPLISQQAIDKLGGVIQKNPLKIANQMSSEFVFARPTLRASMLQTLSYNQQSSGEQNFKLFEVGRVFLPTEIPSAETPLPNEIEMITGILSGKRNQLSWIQSSENLDFFDGKGILENLFSNLGIHPTYHLVASSNDEIKSEPLSTVKNILNTSSAAYIMSESNLLGVLGAINQKTFQSFDLDKNSGAIFFELDLNAIISCIADSKTNYTQISKFPEAYRDLALVVNDDVLSSTIQDIIHKHKLVINSIPFDLYSGQGVEIGRKSIAFRITFQSPQSTLTSKQVDNAMKTILKQLNQELAAELREI